MAEDGWALLRQWAEPRIAALGETRRAAVALAVASRHLAKLTDHLAAAGKDQAEAMRLLEKAWTSLGGQERPTPDEMSEFWWKFAPPALRDVSDDQRAAVMIAGEARCELASAVHCAMHGQVREAMWVLDHGRVAALAAGGEEAEARELALQRRQLEAAASICDLQELVAVFRCQDL